ncbi:MAG TPA: ABC transporter ATP-binding protein [Clostridia bacterium]|jgi:ATP-binding cassette subfamily B protein|nr:ABC transporter ATP-binding protein [Clostridia bacterium]
MKKRQVLKRFASYYKPHWKLFLLDIICALFIASINLFYPAITKNIINDYVPNQNIQMIIIWAVVLLLVYVFRAFLTYVVDYWGHMLGVRMQGDMRKDMFRHLQKLPCAYFDNEKTGSIMSRIVNDLFEVSELAHHGPEDSLISIITIVGAFVMLMTINIPLTLIVFVALPIIAVIASLIRKKMSAAFREMREKTAALNADVATTISGVRVTKAYGVEEYAEKRFNHVNEEYKTSRGKAYKMMGVFYATLGFASDFLYFIVLIAGGLFFYKGLINTGEFAAFILYIAVLINPIKLLVAIYEQLQAGMTGFVRFIEVMDQKSEFDSPDAIDMKDVEGEIEFKDVSFAYKKDDVLSNLNFKLEKGKTTAIVGGSGGGKTTICHLIMRFYEIDSGEILLDGVDITDITRKSLRRNMAIVAQDVFIFDGTVKENIAFGKIDASDEDIIEAAKNAGIHDYVMTLQDKYDTWVGERGIQLSGGQRQRISIARAFLKNPKILILDEATSALDNITEAQIQAAISSLSEGRTTLVVAHRLSTIKNADKIIVLEDGKIVEEGNHKALVQKISGAYSKMWKTMNLEN